MTLVKRLLQFRDIDLSTINEIEKTLQLMTETRIDSYKNKTPELDSDLNITVVKYDECMKFIKSAVSADYLSNIKEEKEASWSFDYVIELHPSKGIDIMARLYSSDGIDKGNIFYNIASLIKIEDDLFAIWSDYKE